MGIIKPFLEYFAKRLGEIEHYCHKLHQDYYRNGQKILVKNINNFKHS